MTDEPTFETPPLWGEQWYREVSAAVTPEEERRLDETDIGYSEEFFSQIDWRGFPDVERVPGRCSGAWVVRDTRVLVEGILANAEDASDEEVAEMFGLPLDVVERILHFAFVREAIALGRSELEERLREAEC